MIGRKRILLVAVFAVAWALAQGGLGHASTGRETLSCRVSVYVSARWYSGRVIRSDHTSCPFAQRVVRSSLSFIVYSGGAGDGDFYVRAFSPVTLRNYRVHCWAHGDLWSSYGIQVDCRAGIGARVIYHAAVGAYR